MDKAELWFGLFLILAVASCELGQRSDRDTRDACAGVSARYCQ